MMSNLPKHYLKNNNTTIDYFCPLIVKVNKGTKASRTTSKQYRTKLSCLTTRAKHIELVDDLSTNKLIIQLRSFICRRDHPFRINTDNGRNFVQVQRHLDQVFKTVDQKRTHCEWMNEWIFSSLLSPWINRAVEIVMKLTNWGLLAVTQNFRKMQCSIIVR